MKYITQEYLIKHNYSTKGVSNIPFKAKCQKCKNRFEYSSVKKFVQNRRNISKDHWMLCQNCFLRFKTVDNKEWLEKNRQAQLIVQNKPEQLEKNRIGVSNSWSKERKTKASEYLKYRWNNDDQFKHNALKNLQHNPSKFINGIGSGGLKGEYKNIPYHSALELSFILWCGSNNIPIKRYDIDPIEYLDENKDKRKYYPDFIINDDTIVEIKGKGMWYQKNYERTICKIQEAKKQLKNYCIYYDIDDQTKLFYKKARRIHHENQK
jgi:hypothetical protein